MAPSATAAFVELLRPRVDRHVVDVAQLTTDVLAACRRQELDAYRLQDVQAVALKLLHCRQPVDFQLQLLQLIRVIKRQVRWSVHDCSDVISVLATLFLSVEAAAIRTIESLVSLIIEIVEEQPKVNEQIQDALARWTRAHPSMYQFMSVKRLCEWEVTKNFDDEAAMLFDGSRYVKEPVLKCLLMSKRSVRERFVRGHDGAELIVHMLKNGSALVKALVLAFANDAAFNSPVFRAQMRDLWWQKHQQECLMAAGDNPELLAVVSGQETLRNDALMRGLQHGEVYEQVIYLNALIEDKALAQHLCVHRNLLGVLSSVLGTRSKMDTATNSATDVKITSELWTLLLQLVNSDEPFVVTANVLIVAQFVVQLVLDVLTTNQRAPSWALNALHTLCSSLLRTEAVCHTIVDSGAISSLVTLLAEQQDDTQLGRDLIVLLRDFAAFDVEFADEIDQVVTILCSYNNHSSSGGSKTDSQDDQPRRHCYQNLLPLYRELPAVRLGRVTGVSKAINAVTVAELLGTQSGDAEKLLMVHFFHNELQLNGLDPVRCTLDDLGEGSNVVVNAVAENLDDFICVALYGLLDGKKAARRVLTVVARNDVVSRKKLREYHSDPSRPALVPAEVLEIEAETRDWIAGGAQDDEQMVYEYSDDDDEEIEDDDEDEKKNGVSDQEGDQQGELIAASSCERPATVSDHTVDTAQKASCEGQDALAALSMDDDDWELV